MDPVEARQLVTTFARDNPQVPQLQYIRDDPDGVAIKNLESGFVNFTFKVTSVDNTHSMVLKHSKPNCKAFPLVEVPMFRQDIEYGTLVRIHSLLPGGCPEPYCYDKTLNTIAMEDLSAMTLLWESLSDLRVDLPPFEQLARLLARLHWGTMRKNVSEQEWESMVELYRKDFGGNDSRAFFFDHCLNADHPITELLEEMVPEFEKIRSDPEIVEKVREVRQMVATEECLVHNDCNDRAVFYKGNRCTLFDFEFSSLGSRCLDIGLPLVPLVLITQFLMHSAGHDQLTRTCRSTFTHFFETYFDNMPDVKDPAKRALLVSQTTACLAIFVFRTVTACSFKNLFPNLPSSSSTRVKVMGKMTNILKTYPAVISLEEMAQRFFSE